MEEWHVEVNEYRELDERALVDLGLSSEAGSTGS
jgi:uncharacterized protein YjiS (DUF1127 family)